MSKHVTFMGWDDAPHLDADAKASLIGEYPPHERDARTKGVPSLGFGAIYPVAESEVVCEPFEVPLYWPRAYGMDVGWNVTACVWGAWDRDSDVVYLYSEHFREHAEPSVHVDGIRARGGWIFGAIDPASKGRGQRDGEQLFGDYINLGLRLITAKNGVEAGLMEVWQRLTSGRLKVFDSLQHWRREYRMYQRNEKGLVVKRHDHLMDATRYLVVSGLDVAAVDPAYLEKMGVVNRGVKSDYDPLAEDAA